MSKKTTFAVVLVALLVAMGAGAFIGSRAGGGAPAVTERKVMTSEPNELASPALEVEQDPSAPPSTGLSPTAGAATATTLPLTPPASPTPVPNSSPPPPIETPVGDGTGI